ncbi:uncharacterized protein HHUB_2085 [Halobacterium hubeiense]|jgi:hypothetical protein|uniref:Uncharacterized protein n=2 Tax=Halobacterium TaxID=2239 RepID=A0A0U5H1N2_9EURY|nr:hypothetical protein [Halobacterium hubeiense]CQH54443.1 uncharacterized protein HHUB_2085 [Halobacterium hubeiense]
MSAETNDGTAPWPQQLLDSEWLLAGAAILYFVISYVLWGVIDIFTVPMG